MFRFVGLVVRGCRARFAASDFWGEPVAWWRYLGWTPSPAVESGGFRTRDVLAKAGLVMVDRIRALPPSVAGHASGPRPRPGCRSPRLLSMSTLRNQRAVRPNATATSSALSPARQTTSLLPCVATIRTPALLTLEEQISKLDGTTPCSQPTSTSGTMTCGSQRNDLQRFLQYPASRPEITDWVVSSRSATR
jgi:hypothetical protein